MSKAILSAHRVIMSRQTEVMADVPRMMHSEIRIDVESFSQPLDLTNENLVQIEKVSRQSSHAVEINYLKLVSAYILANPDRVDALTRLDAKASGLSFATRPEEIKEALLALPAVDRQALASLKLYAALHSFSDDIIREYFDQNLTSSWTRDRLVYPLVYYFINLPEPHGLDQLLAQIFPKTGTGPAERILTKFLLLPDHADTANLALRCYVALLSHPYDALEYIATDLERRCADGEPVGAPYLKEFSKLAVAFPDHRIARLLGIAKRERLPLLDRPPGLFGIDDAGEGGGMANLLSVFDMGQEDAPFVEPDKELLAAIVNVRWSRYPLPKHFDEVFAFQRRFAVLTSARLVRHIATSLFLFSRPEPQRERMDALQGPLLTGCVTPFSSSGPQGYQLSTSGRFPCDREPTAVLELTTQRLNSGAETRSDRIWIKAANWALMPSQAKGDVVRWVELGRERFPILVTPRYLSGMDWHWLTGVIKALGLRPLVDKRMQSTCSSSGNSRNFGGSPSRCASRSNRSSATIAI